MLFRESTLFRGSYPSSQHDTCVKTHRKSVLGPLTTTRPSWRLVCTGSGCLFGRNEKGTVNRPRSPRVLLSIWTPYTWIPVRGTSTGVVFLGVDGRTTSRQRRFRDPSRGCSRVYRHPSHPKGLRFLGLRASFSSFRESGKWVGKGSSVSLTLGRNRKSLEYTTSIEEGEVEVVDGVNRKREVTKQV